MLLYRKKYSLGKKAEMDNVKKSKETTREVGILRAELSTYAERVEELEDALKKTKDPKGGKKRPGEENRGVETVGRRRLKNLQKWGIEDWDQLYEFDREYGIYSPRDKQKLNNIYTKVEMGMGVKMSVLSEGEQCLRKAINNGYKLYTMDSEMWGKILAQAAEEELLPQWDIEFMEKLSGRLIEEEINSKSDMIRGKGLLDRIEEGLEEE